MNVFISDSYEVAEAPRVSELRPSIGEAIDALVGRMLAKSLEDRPADAGAVLQALEGLADAEGGAPPRVSRAREGLTDSERRIVSILLAEPVGVDTARTLTPDHERRECRVSWRG